MISRFISNKTPRLANVLTNNNIAFIFSRGKLTIIVIPVFSIHTGFVFSPNQFIKSRIVKIKVRVRNRRHVIERLHHRVIDVQLSHVR